MNREIKFRGFDIIAQSWIVGGICFDSDIKGRVYITTNYNEMYEVDPKSVGQFTSSFDKNGREIFEGDILSDGTKTVDGKSKLQVFWSKDYACWAIDYSFYQDKSDSVPLYEDLEDFDYKIVGNIYENPELLSTSNSN